MATPCGPHEAAVLRFPKDFGMQIVFERTRLSGFQCGASECFYWKYSNEAPKLKVYPHKSKIKQISKPKYTILIT